MQEVVEGVSRGDRQAMEELFTKNIGLLYSLARRYRTALERDRASSEEDLIQAGYLGLLEAARAWEPERGAWATIAVPYIKNAMRKVVGLHGTRIRAEHGAASLNEPIGEDDQNGSRMDLLEDPSAPDIDEALLLEDLQQHVREAVREIDEPVMRGVVWKHYILSQPYQKIGEEMGFSYQCAKQLGDKGRRQLRKNPRMRALVKAYHLDEQTRFYAHKGYHAFNSDWTSTTEAAALWRIEQRKRMGLD